MKAAFTCHLPVSRCVRVVAAAAATEYRDRIQTSMMKASRPASTQLRNAAHEQATPSLRVCFTGVPERGLAYLSVCAEKVSRAVDSAGGGGGGGGGSRALTGGG
jgi:hypothetical protein